MKKSDTLSVLAVLWSIARFIFSYFMLINYLMPGGNFTDHLLILWILSPGLLPAGAFLMYFSDKKASYLRVGLLGLFIDTSFSALVLVLANLLQGMTKEIKLLSDFPIFWGIPLYNYVLLLCTIVGLCFIMLFGYPQKGKREN